MDCVCLSQVVMVAVPTVLGIASIRVYTVSEAPADGLVSREKVGGSFNISPCSEGTLIVAHHVAHHVRLSACVSS